MMNALKFAISILALAAVCLAQDGLTIDNKHQERVSAPEVEKIYSSACSVVQWEFDIRHPHQATLSRTLRDLGFGSEP
jgi:hypothetical protein